MTWLVNLLSKTMDEETGKTKWWFAPLFWPFQFLFWFLFAAVPGALEWLYDKITGEK